MGQGYWILIADGFGHGLELINGRLLDEGGRNWWPCDSNTTNEQIFEKHKMDRFEFSKIVR